MPALLFDCYSGAAGDMILGALLDLGASLDDVQQAIASLGIGEVTLEAHRQASGGLTGTAVKVHWQGEQAHRTFSDILQILEKGKISDRARTRARRAFEMLASAEAKVHGVKVDEVHFHEVGAVDAIVDVVGTVVALDALGVVDVYATPLPLGRGFVDAAHGKLPLPAPATMEILAAVRAPVYWEDVRAELVTPTGASLIASLAGFDVPRMRIAKVGYGIGSHHLPWPNCVRAVLGDVVVPVRSDDLVVLETNVDDMTGEELGFAMEQLLASGALDVYFTPIQMKKNRPAIKLALLAYRWMTHELVENVLRLTTTLGVRVLPVERHAAIRRTEQFLSSLGPVRVKVKELGGHAVEVSPEYEDCASLARDLGVPLRQVYDRVRDEATKRFFPRSH